MGNCQAHALNSYRACEKCMYLRGELVAGVDVFGGLVFGRMELQGKESRFGQIE